MNARDALLALLLVLPTARGNAHDLYLFPDTYFAVGKSTLQVAIHNGDAFPQSEESPVIARLKDAQLLAANGQVAVIQGLHESDTRVIGNVTVPADTGNFLLSVRTEPNFIELPPDKFLAYLREEGLTEIIDWRARHGESAKPGRERYAKFAKALLLSDKSDEFFRHVVGLPIEIVPEQNPYKLHAGSQLSVRVLFKGKPAAGLPLEASWSDGKTGKTIIVGRTDAQGRVSVPLAAAGKWRLHALIMQRCADLQIADWESFWASFTFELR